MDAVSIAGGVNVVGIMGGMDTVGIMDGMDTVGIIGEMDAVGITEWVARLRSCQFSRVLGFYRLPVFELCWALLKGPFRRHETHLPASFCLWC